MSGITLDAGALIAIDRNDRRVIALLAQARASSTRVTVPATALAQAVRRLERQVGLARLIRHSTTDVVPLDRVDAAKVGRLLTSSGTNDIANAHVVICARRARQPVVTSDPADLARLDPTLDLVTI